MDRETYMDLVFGVEAPSSLEASFNASALLLKKSQRNGQDRGTHGASSRMKKY